MLRVRWKLPRECRRLWLPLALFVLATPSGAEPFEVLTGSLHARALDFGTESMVSALLGEPEALGRFSLVGEPDVETSPRTVRLETDAGATLLGMAAESTRLLGPPRRDPLSSYALRDDAPEQATCPMGTEPDCWRSGDPPLAIDDVVTALCSAFELAIPSCPFWAQRLRQPFRGALFAPLDDATSDPCEAFLGVVGSATSNFLEQLVCLSLADPAVSPPPLDSFDPENPFSMDPGQCSIAQPEFCRLVIAYRQDLSSQLALAPGLGTVPDASWFWEAGAEYAVVEATGDFASYLGGTVFVLGPEGARISGSLPDVSDPMAPAPLGVSFLLAGSGQDPAAATIFFGAVPEPGDTLSGVAAVLTLGALVRRRHAVRRATPRPGRTV